MMHVTFSFDPACPWTWRAARWLTEVAEERDLDVEWASFSLAIVNGDDIPDDHVERMKSSTRALRLVEALRAARRNGAVWDFYRELAERVHDANRDFNRDVTVEAARAAGVEDFLDALDDATLDAAVRASHESAFAAAGPDIGSPVLQIRGCERGLHGPILGEDLDTKDALEVWDCVASLMAQPAFFEVKRGRS
jgi:predicted DsbA family dithiol-disulfide isomerase